MSMKVITGNIFTSNCQTIVNTVNCVGVMGAGIALECRLRYPEMYSKYVDLCKAKQIDIGKLWIYKSTDKSILNFPTKKHWKHPSKPEYLNAGLEKFVSVYEERGIESIAFPLLGADKGGIPHEESLQILKRYLEPLDIEIEVYRYSPTANDDLYESTMTWLLSQDTDHISASTGLRKNSVLKVLEAIQSGNIYQLNQLGQIKGIGIKTLEKIFAFAQSGQLGQSGQSGQSTLPLL